MQMEDKNNLFLLNNNLDFTFKIIMWVIKKNTGQVKIFAIIFIFFEKKKLKKILTYHIINTFPTIVFKSLFILVN